MPLEDMSEEDMITVEAARKVAVAFGYALHVNHTHDATSFVKEPWEAFADELCEFVDLVEN